LRATGIGNFLHVRADALRWLGRLPIAASIRKAPVIRRRSGVRKFEVDLRWPPFCLASTPLQIVAVVFLSAAPGRGPLLRPLPRGQLRRALALSQPYGASQPEWQTVSANLRGVSAFELRRGRGPAEAMAPLRSLLVPRAE
jgi:hypothetical protein